MVKDKKAVRIKACLVRPWQVWGRRNLLGIPGNEGQKGIVARIGPSQEVFDGCAKSPSAALRFTPDP